MTIRSSTWTAALAMVLFASAIGCGDGTAGEVFGTVTVDGQTPAVGSSINFVPIDGKSPSAGATIEGGKYSARVPLGGVRVEIRVPRASNKARASQDGPGPGSANFIEESLPAKYNDATELKFDVKPGKNEKKWDLTTK